MSVELNYGLLFKSINYTFKNLDLLKLALTHRSVGHENNERLEFLGDAILSSIMADILFHQFPKAREGELSQLRMAVVRGETLTEIAIKLNLGEYIQFGMGERKSGGRHRSSILENALEALIGAIYLDLNSDLKQTQSIIQPWFSECLEKISLADSVRDAKSLLQELLQGLGCPLPEYSIQNISGAQHEQEFTVQCKIYKNTDQTELLFEGKAVGSSRKKAEQVVAQMCLDQIKID